MTRYTHETIEPLLEVFIIRGHPLNITEIGNWVTSQQPEFTQRLRELVNTNSYTKVHPNVDQCMQILDGYAEDIGLTTEIIKQRHRRYIGGNGKGPRVVLSTHIDTVHPPDSSFKTYTALEDGFVTGPGVGDMKGGLLMALYTLKAMSELLPDYDLHMTVGADEEIGSPSIRDWYQSGAMQADYCICMEPGFPQAELGPNQPYGVVARRKGSATINFEVEGVASHSGGAYEKGLSAVKAMAHKIVDLYAINDFDKGVNINVGVVEGGEAMNTIAPSAKAAVNLRYWTTIDGETAVEQVREIVHRQHEHNAVLKHYERISDFDVSIFLPPMERNERNEYMIDVVLEEAERLGQNVVPIERGGGSDANWISGTGVPTICGMGAPAEGIHTHDEMIHLPTLFERLELLVATTYRIISEHQ